MHIGPRDHSVWWIDQHGRRWSAFELWRARCADELEPVLYDDNAEVRVERTADGETLYLVRTTASAPHRDPTY